MMGLEAPMNGPPPPNDGGGKVHTNSCFSPSRACAPRVLLLQHPWPPRLLCGSVSLGLGRSSCCHGPASINRAASRYGWDTVGGEETSGCFGACVRHRGCWAWSCACGPACVCCRTSLRAFWRLLVRIYHEQNACVSGCETGPLAAAYRFCCASFVQLPHGAPDHNICLEYVALRRLCRSRSTWRW